MAVLWIKKPAIKRGNNFIIKFKYTVTTSQFERDMEFCGTELRGRDLEIDCCGNDGVERLRRKLREIFGLGPYKIEKVKDAICRYEEVPAFDKTYAFRIQI